MKTFYHAISRNQTPMHRFQSKISNKNNKQRSSCLPQYFVNKQFFLIASEKRSQKMPKKVDCFLLTSYVKKLRLIFHISAMFFTHLMYIFVAVEFKVAMALSSSDMILIFHMMHDFQLQLFILALPNSVI